MDTRPRVEQIAHRDIEGREVQELKIPMNQEGTETRQPAPKLVASHINFYYGSSQALHDISLNVAENQITALIGPSGCGKSTFIRTLNRLHETVSGTRLEGEIRLDGQDILK